jgi:fucose 4-O-acetylase-like acetyltransferase
MRRWAAVLVVTLALGSTAAASDLQNEPDSLRAVLGLGLSRTGLVELSGATVTEFRMYTHAKRSRVAWWHEGTLYLYDLDGPDHEQRASALLSALSSGSLVTFVANRHPKKRHGSVPVAEVQAIQVAASFGAALPRR